LAPNPCLQTSTGSWRMSPVQRIRSEGPFGSPLARRPSSWMTSSKASVVSLARSGVRREGSLSILPCPSTADYQGLPVGPASLRAPGSSVVARLCSGPSHPSMRAERSRAKVWMGSGDGSVCQGYSKPLKHLISRRRGLQHEESGAPCRRDFLDFPPAWWQPVSTSTRDRTGPGCCCHR
jgi:hypothetical protein